MDNLTRRQTDVLAAIQYLTVQHGYPPTIRQLCDELNVAGPATVHDHLAILERKGAITRSPDRRRLIQIVPQPT